MIEIVKNISNILVYFVPGYLVLILVYRALKTKMSDDNYKVTAFSVVISYLINELSLYINSIINNFISVTLLNVIIALIVGLLCSYLIKRDIFTVEYLENSGSILSFFLQVDSYDVACIVCLKDGSRYTGYLEGVDDINNSQILLSSFSYYDKDGNKISSYEDKESYYILINYNEVHSIQIRTDKIE